MKPTGGSVAAFIATVTPAARRRDAETLAALLQEVSGREPELWGTIIGFGHCRYRYPTGTEGETGLLGFAPRRAATTIYLLDGVEQHAEALARLGPAHHRRRMPLRQRPRTGRSRRVAQHPRTLPRVGRSGRQRGDAAHRHPLSRRPAPPSAHQCRCSPAPE